MIRIVVALASLILIGAVSTARAQETHFGGKLGPSFAVLSLDDDGDSYDRRIAIAAGGFAVLPVSRNVAVQVEALFSPKGAKLDDPELGATSTLLLDYLEFPVLARIDGNKSRFHVFGGPYFGIRVSAKRQISVSGGGITSGIREDMSDEVERFDAGLVAGGGIHIGRRIVADARYSWGLTNVNSDTSDNFRLKHRVLTIMAGVRF